jgi:hypothetical protein
MDNLKTCIQVKPRGRTPVYSNDSERLEAYKKRHNKKSASFYLSPELILRLDEFMLARDETKSQVVERALTQFFRKR